MRDWPLPLVSDSYEPAAALVDGVPSRTDSRRVLQIAQLLEEAFEKKPQVTTTLSKLLIRHLESDFFLQLQVTPNGFRVHGVVAQTEPIGRVPALLHGNQVVELFFKKGVTQVELERFVRVLQAGARKLPPDQSLATLFWEADLRHVGVRSKDEFPARRGGLEEIHAGSSVEIEGSRPRTDRASPHEDDIDLQTRLVEFAQLTPQDAEALDGLRIPDMRSTLRSLVTLVDGHSSSRPELHPDLLGVVVEGLVRGRNPSAAHEMLLWAREGTGDGAHPFVDESWARLARYVADESGAFEVGTQLDDPTVRSEDRAALQEILSRLSSAVEPLCDLSGRMEEMQDRRLVGHVLAAVSASDPEPLARYAAGKPWHVTRNMANVLGEIGCPRVLPHLDKWARHEDARVRMEVARALGTLAHGRSTAILCRLLEDKESRVRQSAVWSLATLDDARALRSLRHILFEDRNFRSRLPEERENFFMAYGRLAGDEAFQELARMLEQRHLVGLGWQVELRRGAALALGETNRPEAVQVLERHIGARDLQLREACRRALGNLQNRGPDTMEDDPSPARRSRVRTESAETVGPSPLAEWSVQAIEFEVSDEAD